MTFSAIADALQECVDAKGPVSIPVVVGRGGAHLVQGMVALNKTLANLSLPHVFFGPDTPITLVAEYAVSLMRACEQLKAERPIMNATTLSSILNKGDRVAVSNMTGREAMKVSIVSQQYCDNIVGGWALGKDNEVIKVPGGRDIRVFGQFEDLMKDLPAKERPNKVIVYSPPDAVYGDVKEVVENGEGTVETIFVITEHVSVEVTAKLKRLCDLAHMDIIGCNTLGVINAHAGVRVGAVGGDAPARIVHPRERDDHFELRQHGEHHCLLSAVGRAGHFVRHLHGQGSAYPDAAERLPRPGREGQAHGDRRPLRRTRRHL